MSESASFRDSGILWAPQIPSDWDVKPFAAAFQETRKRNTGMVEHNLLSLSFGRIVRKPINTETGLLPESFETYQIVEPDTLVFRFTDLQNDQRSLRTARVTERGIITSAYGAATPIGLDAHFADYLMRSYDTTKVFYSFGGGVRQSLKLRDIARMPVIAPPNSIQRMIADYLDRETAQIDTLIAKQEQLVLVLQERRALVVAETTAGRTTGADTRPSGVDWLGEIDSQWPVVRVRHIADVGTGYGDTIDADPDGRYPFYVRSQTPQRSNEFDHVGPAVLTAGDGAGVAKVFHLATGQFKAHQRVYVINSFRGVLPEYFLAYFSAYFDRVALDGSAKSTVDSVRRPMITNMPIPLPPLDEQRRIVAYLDEQTAKIDTLIAKAERFIELAKERRAALITAAVTGQLDVTAA